MTISFNDTIRAIIARQDGVFDDPALVAFGPLGDMASDIQEIKRQGNCPLDLDIDLIAKEQGYTGKNDPRFKND